MARKRKYEKVSNYWVYSIKVPSIGKYYIGVSKRQCSYRWRKSQYKSNSLNQYLEEWDSMEKTVLIDNLTKEQAYQYEDNILRALSINNLCINTNRSGLITNDKNAYQKQRYEDNKERIKQYYEDNKERIKQYYEDNKEQIKEYQKQYREDNKEKVQEYYENNKEKYNQQAKQWQKDNKEKYKEYQRVYQRQRYLKKKLEKQQNQQLNLF
jgi:hypothetical protein